MKLKTSLLSLVPAVSLTAGSVQLSNEYWDVKIDPDNGCKVTNMVYKPAGKELVNTWKPQKRRQGSTMFGGVWGGHMGGSYSDEQGVTPYKVIRQSKNQIVAVWENKFPNFTGLKEERTITLNGAELRVKVKISNSSKEKRTFIYRMQDFFGSRKDGKNMYGFVPGSVPEVFPFYDFDLRERVFMKPAENELAIFDSVEDYGMLISSRGQLNGIFTWFSRSDNSSTVEFFMEQAYLAPGKVWEAEFAYRGFAPSKLSNLPEKWQKRLNPEHVKDVLSQQIKGATPLPYHGVCKLNLKDDSLQLFPVSAADRAAGKGYPAVHRMSLDSMKLFGTPGERVDFVFALKAGKKKINSAWELTPFTAEKSGWNLFGGKKNLDSAKWDLRYLTKEGYFLVHDQKLTDKNAELTIFGNALKDSDKWSDLSLEPGEVAWVKLSCTIPENAEAGTYESSVKVAGETVNIALDVLPFKLNRENAKAFGTFFRAYITPSRLNPERRMSKEEFLESMRFADENWNNSIVLYTTRRDELIWVVDQLYKMGWRNSVICPIYRLLSPKQTKELEEKYGYTFLTWGVDEPANYKALVTADVRLKGILKAKHRNPTFTPSTFMGALYADIRPEYIPIFNTNGMMTILMDRTSRYAAQNRTVFWYSCPTGMLTVREQLKERLLHGLYLWKMPARGILDWGEDVHVKKIAGAGYCGYVGKKFLSTIRRDNSYEGYKDYLYLKTLQDTVAANPKAPAAAKARKFLRELSNLLDDNYYNAVVRVDDIYLNSIREKAARLTAEVLEGK